MVSLDAYSLNWLKSRFFDWYSTEWKPWAPERSNWHQFKFQLFSGKWVIPVDKRIRSAKILRKNLLKFIHDPVKNVYYSVIRWLSPKEARRKDRTSLDVCLGGPLVFDLDIADTDIVHYHDGLESAFQTVTKLRDFIEENWGYRKTRTVFSGNRGFHLYVDDFRLEDFVEKIDPLNREKQEERIRSQILKKVFDVGFSVDEKVTSDTRRIIRLPNTLHGSTGFLSARVDVSKRFALSDFIAFDSSKEVKIKVCTPINAFRIDDNIFGPFAKDKSYLVPEYLAVFLVAKGLSVVQS